MENPMYENKAYVTDGFTHGCYWKTSGKFEFYADNLIHQNFETNMSHHHYTNSSNTKSSSSGVPYSDSGGGAASGGGSTMDSYYTNSAKGGAHDPEILVGGASSEMLGAYSSYNPMTYQQQPSGSTSGSGRKLPNVARNGSGGGSKRQLPNVQGRSNSSLGSSDYRLATQSPTGRRLPVPQRSMKGGAGGGVQPPLIDNFNIDLSVKARKSISGPIDEDSLKRLNLGNSINYYCDLSQNKENFMTTSAFYMNNEDMDEYCYSDLLVTSQITLSSRKIKKLPKMPTTVSQANQQPRTSQSMSFISADVNAAYRGYGATGETPYTNPLYAESDYYNDDDNMSSLSYRDNVPALSYNEVPSMPSVSRSVYSTAGGSAMSNHYSSYNDHDSAGMNGEDRGTKAKKMLPTIHKNQEQLGYPYNKATYPTTTTSSYRDDGQYNGHKESYDNHVVEKRHEAVTKSSLMNDRVSSLKSRSRSTTPVSSGSSGKSDYASKQLPNNTYLDGYQGYDAMNHVTTTSTTANSGAAVSSQYASTATGANSQYSNVHTTTPKLLPKPVPSSNKSNYLASPEKKPTLRRSPELSDPYDNHHDAYDMSGSQYAVPTTSASSRNHEPDPYVNDRRGSSYEDVHRKDPYNDPYDVHQDDPDAYMTGGVALPDELLEDTLPAALKKPGASKEGGQKKQLHFFDEREECFDEELEQLEHSIGKKGEQALAQQQQQQQQLQQNGSPLVELAMDGQPDKIDPLLGVTGVDAIQMDISKDITQQAGKRDNFNARNKWLWAYDQIINVSTVEDKAVFSFVY